MNMDPRVSPASRERLHHTSDDQLDIGDKEKGRVKKKVTVLWLGRLENNLLREEIGERAARDF